MAFKKYFTLHITHITISGSTHESFYLKCQFLYGMVAISIESAFISFEVLKTRNLWEFGDIYFIIFITINK